eukprot:CAMPEP_0183537014 /NCGR_PEP_ID=MMETSP0371-20130417/28642_1 /TAXON_ID=268820 /ORGANISM="Peridinium aciculiferum, Strain PAER-2" /LENGTH=522 /DNA_ID=CAMNT_0025737687 /DNA_START=70 /DNA_END=1638 /DNA_ORIENTATION=-
MAEPEGVVPFLQIFICFTLLLTAWELYLDFRQLKKNKEKSLPDEIKDLVPLDRFEKSQVYQVDKKIFSIFSTFVHLAANIFEVVYLWPLMWKLSKDVVGDNEYLRSIAWQIMTSFVSMPISIPLELYGDFVIEARHGFNKKTIKLFVIDTIKSSLISIVMTSLLIPIIIAVIRWGGEHFYFYIWIVCQVLLFVVMFVYPTVIMPLFNKFEPLHDAQLRQRIEGLAGGLNYPLQRLFQMDGSTRSAHSNAYLFGFWKNKRIVLYDTLLQVQINLSKEAGSALGFEYVKEDAGLRLKSVKLESTAAGKWNEMHKGRVDEIKDGELVVGVKKDSDIITDLAKVIEEVDKMMQTDAQGSLNIILDSKPYTTDEILAILCHEIGHWFHGHVSKMLVVSSIHIFVIFRLYAFAMYSPSLFISFGFDPTERSIMVGLSIFMLMFTPVETIVGFGMTSLTRMNEYQADEFAVRQKRATELASGLRKLCIENLGDVNPDPWYAWFHHTHPALVERLKAIQAKDAIINKKSQ